VLNLFASTPGNAFFDNLDRDCLDRRMALICAVLQGMDQPVGEFNADGHYLDCLIFNASVRFYPRPNSVRAGEATVT
jgi:hypothetical protein